MNNNPIRYNDPTGHVCSDPEDENGSCEGGGNGTVSKDYNSRWLRSFLKDRYDWNVSSDFSEAELKLIYQTGLDIESYVDGLTGGTGLDWMLNYLGDITITHGENLDEYSETLPTFQGTKIWLGKGWLNSGGWDSKQLLAHELGHVLDIRTGMNASVQLYEDMGGRGFSWPFRKPDDILPWRQDVNGGYGNTGINDYFAEAFSWTIYDKTNTPSGVSTLIDAMITDQASIYGK